MRRELGKKRKPLQGHDMMTFTELASVASDPAAPLLTSFDWQWLRTWPASRHVPRAHRVRPALLQAAFARSPARPALTGADAM
jgi:hypothetical protein